MIPANNTEKSTAIINWDDIFQPATGTPRQMLGALFAFAHLYSYQWPVIDHMPKRMQSGMRTAFAVAYLPYVAKLFLSKNLTLLINSLKLGKISQEQFFNTLIDGYFPFLRHNAEINPVELVKNTWLDPRIAPLTAKQQQRLEFIVENFSSIILIANSNTPDIEAFIRNLFQNPELTAKLQINANILNELHTYQRTDEVPAAKELFALCWQLSPKIRMLTSVQMGEWKVQTGKTAADTGSSGFLRKLLEQLQPSLVLSTVPADLRTTRAFAAQAQSSTTVMTGEQYFQDTGKAERFITTAYENWPYLAILLIAIAIFIKILSML